MFTILKTNKTKSSGPALNYRQRIIKNARRQKKRFIENSLFE